MKHSCLHYILCLIGRPECYERVSDLAKLLERVKSCFHVPHRQERPSRRDSNANTIVVFLIMSQKKTPKPYKTNQIRKNPNIKLKTKGEFYKKIEEAVVIIVTTHNS